MKPYNSMIIDNIRYLFFFFFFFFLMEMAQSIGAVVYTDYISAEG